MDREYGYYINRTMCDVLEEIRKCATSMNFSYLPGLIEELQSMANRMEAGLGDKKDLLRLSQERSELLKEVKKLKAEVKSMKPKKRKSGLKD